MSRSEGGTKSTSTLCVAIGFACDQGKFFRRGKPVQSLLPARPVMEQRIESWWVVFLGSVTEDDIKVSEEGSRSCILNLVIFIGINVMLTPPVVHSCGVFIFTTLLKH